MEPITEAKGVIVLWDFDIQTDRKIKSNWSDIGVKDYKWDKKTCLQNDMSVSADAKISIKKYDKISKYKDLEIEIEKNVAS